MLWSGSLSGDRGAEEPASVIPREWKGHAQFDWRGRTDDEGRFTWSSAPEEALPYSIGKTGFISVTDRELRPGEENVVVLEPAARIVGRVTDAESGEPIEAFGIGMGRYAGDTRVSWPSSRQTIRQEEGRYELAPGGVTEVRFGGGGSSVAGRLASDDPDFEVDWQAGYLVLATERPTPPEDADLNAYQTWAKSPEVRRAFEEVRRFHGTMEADGTFRIEDVPPGDYELSVSVRTPAESPLEGHRTIGSLRREVVIPETGGDEPHDLGELTVAVGNR